MFKKNDEIIGSISGYASGGEGVLHHEGFPVFVQGAIMGEEVKVKILKCLKNYAFGKICEIITPSIERISPICPVSKRCGGCSLMHMSYEEQLRFKKIKVADTMRKIGSFSDLKICDTIPSPRVLNYRNKVSVPLTKTDDGIMWGFYAVHSHNVVACDKCFLHDEINNKIISTVIKYMESQDISPYCEDTHSGTVRHIYIRKAPSSGEIMVSLVSKKQALKNEELLVKMLLEVSKDIKSIIINVNPHKTNVILGEKNRVLFGNEYIHDILLDTKFKIHHNSFYQINSYTTSLLYEKAISLLGDLEGKTVLDLYCGIGTISLIMAKRAKCVYGIEYVPEAIKDACFNAEMNNIQNANFYAGDAAKEIINLQKKGIKPDYIVLDPPRKGCDTEVLQTSAALSPKKIVYISCDCATLARDMKIFKELGYNATEVYPFDMFPQTAHVESVALLTRSTSI